MRTRARASTRQIVNVYSRLYWRMCCSVDEVTSDQVKLSIEASYPTWSGAPLGVNPLNWYTCALGDELVFRLRATSLLPLVRTIRIVPAAAVDGRVDLWLDLPRGWSVVVVDLPPADEDGPS